MHKYSVLCIVLAILLALGSARAAAQPAGPALRELVANGTLVVGGAYFRGTVPVALLRLTNQGVDSLQVSVEKGTIIEFDDAAVSPIVLVGAGPIVLPSGETRDSVEVFGFLTRAPGPGQTIVDILGDPDTLYGATVRPELADRRIIDVLDRAAAENIPMDPNKHLTGQLAVWLAADPQLTWDVLSERLGNQPGNLRDQVVALAYGPPTATPTITPEPPRQMPTEPPTGPASTGPPTTTPQDDRPSQTRTALALAGTGNEDAPARPTPEPTATTPAGLPAWLLPAAVGLLVLTLAAGWIRLRRPKPATANGASNGQSQPPEVTVPPPARADEVMLSKQITGRRGIDSRHYDDEDTEPVTREPRKPRPLATPPQDPVEAPGQGPATPSSSPPSTERTAGGGPPTQRTGPRPTSAPQGTPPRTTAATQTPYTAPVAVPANVVPPTREGDGFGVEIDDTTLTEEQPLTAAEAGNRFYLEGVSTPGLPGKLAGMIARITNRRAIITRQALPEVVLDNPSLSAPHAMLAVGLDGSLRVTDLHSSNGTMLDGVALPAQQDVPVRLGQTIHFGTAAVRFDPSKMELVWLNAPPGKLALWSLIKANRWLVTRSKTPFIVLDDGAISAPHAFIDASRGFELRPLKNSNPLLVDDKLVTAHVTINPNSKIRLGETDFYLRTDKNQLPERIGAYRVVNFVADGGLADVYLVEADGGGQRWALKVPKESLYLNSRELRSRWIQEIAVMREVCANPPPDSHVVRFVNSDVVSGRQYLVMNYVDGCSLQKIRRHKGQAAAFTPGEAYDIMRQLARALIYLHEQRIAHCDVKPGNMLIDRSGWLYLADFGIATRFGQDAPQLATHAYMPPEVPGGTVAAPTLDIYAFGVILYVLLTGNRIGDGGRAASPHGQRAAAARDDLEQTNLAPAGAARGMRLDTLPPQISQLIAYCTEADPAQRLNDARVLIHVLDQQPEHGDLAALVDEATAT